MIILIDNYDSFVYNLARYVSELNEDCLVLRNDQTSISELEKYDPNGFILSPGPCGPHEAGICLELVKHFHQNKPILGVCLGHQVIGQFFGGEVGKYSAPKHGKSSPIDHTKTNLFKNLPSPMQVGRYHSLSLSKLDHTDLKIEAKSDDGEIMAISHPIFPSFGVQFHPESILTEHGHALLSNFIEKC